MSRRTESAAVFPGVYAARVESNEDKDHLGRIQVSVPTLFDEAKPEHFAWARPCFPYGHFFVPEKGDFVWVAFENGDPSSPVWLGTWYPQKKTPKEADVSPPVKRVVRSAKGHVIILDDDAETMTIQDKSGSRVELSKDGMVIKSSKDLTIDSGGAKVVIKDGAVEITPASGKDISLNGSAKKVALVGDSTTGHMHTLSGSAGPYPIVGTAIQTTDTIVSSAGSPNVKAGG